MDESTDGAWFHTHEGERCGPVTFAELVEKAREGSLNPRLDMVWTKGMEAWKPAGEVEGIFEKRKAEEERESLAPTGNPYTPPKHGDLGEKPIMDGWPGSGRRSYLIAVLLFPVFWNVLVAVGTPFLTAQLGKEIMGVVVIAAAFVPLVVSIHFTLKRLVNVGMSRWWIIWGWLPVINLWIGYRTIACPGGYVFHKKLDKAGVVLAIIYWLLVIAAVLASIVVAALLFGWIGNPEIQEKLREIIRQATPRAARS